MLDRLGYSFVTVESSGVNAVFLDPAWFEPGFATLLDGLDFCENRFQLRTFGAGWEAQLAYVRHLPLVTVE